MNSIVISGTVVEKVDDTGQRLPRITFQVYNNEMRQVVTMVAYGETGVGQTTWLKALLWALAATNGPEALRLVIVDPKAVDLLPFAGLPHLARPLAFEPDEAEEAVEWLAGQVEERRRLSYARRPAASTGTTPGRGRNCPTSWP